MRFVFLSTSFGFGPVSKAVTIARALQRRCHEAVLAFYGDGIALDFARRAHVFDEIHELAVDTDLGRARLRRTAADATAVVSVLNMSVAADWNPVVDPPLYVVDSLDWMWHAPPPGIDNAQAVFVQDFLLDREVEFGSNRRAVPPIDAAQGVARGPRSGELLINLSGLANPFVHGDLYLRYARLVLEALLPEATTRYGSVLVCTNAALSAALRDDYPNVQIGHLPHDEFVRRLARCERLITAPGITTTVEALSMGVPPRFLPPQNYSQALILERYRDVLPPGCLVPLSAIHPSLRIPAGLPEAIGVAAVEAALRACLGPYSDVLGDRLRGLLKTQEDPLPGLGAFVRHRWTEPGQDSVAELIVRNATLTDTRTRHASS